MISLKKNLKFAAPGEVDSLTASPSQTASITIEWKVPDFSPCDITNYRVNYTLILLDQCLESHETRTTDTNVTSITLTDTEFFSTYNISVWAISGNENGPAEHTTVVTEETSKTFELLKFINKIL